MEPELTTETRLYFKSKHLEMEAIAKALFKNEISEEDAVKGIKEVISSWSEGDHSPIVTMFFENTAQAVAFHNIFQTDLLPLYLQRAAELVATKQAEPADFPTEIQQALYPLMFVAKTTEPLPETFEEEGV